MRLFEAAACGVPILSDEWRGLENFFIPGREILVARTTEEVSRYLRHLDDKYLQQIGAAARARMLAAHTAEHRARELEKHVQEAGGLQPPSGLGRRRTDPTASAVEAEFGI